ncbi:MAG: FAD-dependent monooxygenase [Alphaproteobacteria bacterium]|nr:FAD-dependent monooxygenase [Alphaproteobacteria bacterium]MCB9930206.1 FAD-dependent monooxygenase [Alphaproteobacteria bacterium]
MTHIVIVGAGIGGTAAALALLKHGFAVTLLEQASTFGEVGAGVQMSPNANRVIDALGRLDAVMAVAMHPDAAIATAWNTGEHLRVIPYGEHVLRRWGYPYVHLYRPDLIAALSDGLPPGVARMGAKVVRVREEAGRVGAELADGTVVWGDVLVGADGIHSTVQKHLHGDQPARFTGNMAWRGLCPGEAARTMGAPVVSGVCWGPGSHFVNYYVGARGGEALFMNWVGVVPHDGSAIESWSAEGRIADALGDFAGWHRRITDIISATPRAMKWALHDRDPLPFWSRGRVTLLGDACHPMLPFMAQGAAQSIEDGYVLARCLAEVPDPAEALQRYQRNRMERTAWVQEGSRRNERVFHLSDPQAVAERNARLKAEVETNPDGVSADQSRLFGHDVVAGPLAP